MTIKEKNKNTMSIIADAIIIFALYFKLCLYIFGKDLACSTTNKDSNELYK